MPPKNHRITVIIIPRTDQRTLRFDLTPVWLAVAGLLLVALAASLVGLVYRNQTLQAELADLSEVKRINVLQLTELQQMARKVRRTEEKLNLLERLEQQIRQLAGGQTSSKRSPAMPQQDNGASTYGRGGPSSTVSLNSNLPLLSNLLPPDVSSLLFSRNDHLPAELHTMADQRQAMEKRLLHAQELNTVLEAQLDAMAHWEETLTKGRETLVSFFDYLAHRPSIRPVTGGNITDRFGRRWSPFGWGWQLHDGLDFAQNYWAPVMATGNGVVASAGWQDGGYGYSVTIDHGYGLSTMYAHMVDWDVRVGTRVERGDVIGWVGSSGASTGPHLHYEVRVEGTPVDPSPYIQ